MGILQIALEAPPHPPLLTADPCDLAAMSWIATIAPGLGQCLSPRCAECLDVESAAEAVASSRLEP
jgi:hypothetical protein